MGLVWVRSPRSAFTAALGVGLLILGANGVARETSMGATVGLGAGFIRSIGESMGATSSRGAGIATGAGRCKGAGIRRITGASGA